jgi:hypothetical protein
MYNANNWTRPNNKSRKGYRDHPSETREYIEVYIGTENRENKSAMQNNRTKKNDFDVKKVKIFNNK